MSLDHGPVRVDLLMLQASFLSCLGHTHCQLPFVQAQDFESFVAIIGVRMRFIASEFPQLRDLLYHAASGNEL
jgi:hypothetical protein